MTEVTNISSAARRWDALANKTTNRTLHLEPGESAEVDLPEGFSDPHLSVGDSSASVPVFTPPASAPTFVPSTDSGDESDDTETE